MADVICIVDDTELILLRISFKFAIFSELRKKKLDISIENIDFYVLNTNYSILLLVFRRYFFGYFF